MQSIEVALLYIHIQDQEERSQTPLFRLEVFQRVENLDSPKRFNRKHRSDFRMWYPDDYILAPIDSVFRITFHASTDPSIHALDVRLPYRVLEDRMGTYQYSIFKYQPFTPSFQLRLRRLFRRTHILPYGSAP